MSFKPGVLQANFLINVLLRNDMFQGLDYILIQKFSSFGLLNWPGG